MTQRTMDALACLAAIAVFVFILSFTHKAQAGSVTVDQSKEILRLQYTEFCATVKKPPQLLIDAINEAMKEDPKSWLPVVTWFNRIGEKYAKAGCGDV